MDKKRRWRTRVLGIFLAAALGVLIGTTVVAWRGVQAYIHPPRRTVTQTPTDFDVTYQDITLTTADGLSLAAWYHPSENGRIILVAHGFVGHRDPSLFASLARGGYGVLAWDFRAHGASGGDTCTMGGNELLDVEAALAFAQAQPNTTHIGAWGESMGAAATLRAAARHAQIEAVVIDSAYPSLAAELDVAVYPAMVRPFTRLLAETLAGVRFDAVRPIDDIARIAPRPVLIIHSKPDGVTPPDSGEQLYAAAGEPRYLWLEANVGHTQMRRRFPELYTEQVLDFFNAALLDDGNVSLSFISER